jgi:transcription-repair coupling factor (superfamily II helicase)
MSKLAHYRNTKQQIAQLQAELADSTLTRTPIPRTSGQ